MPEVVKLPVIQPRPHISFSEIGLFYQCQWRWVLDYLQGRRSNVYGIDLSFGTAIHSTLELLKNKDPALRPTPEKAKSIFVRMMVREHMTLKKHIAENRRKAAEAGIELVERKPYDIRAFIDAGKVILDGVNSVDLLRDGQVIWNEFPIYEDLDRSDDLKIKFKGFIDIAIKMPGRGGKSLLYICDFKTCSWGWGKDKRSDEDKHAQLFMYKHFICKKFGLDPKNVRTTFILLKKKPQNPALPIELFTVSAGPKSLERAMEKIQRTITKMHSGVYVKNREVCVSPYGDRCPYLDTPECPSSDGLLKLQQEPTSEPASREANDGVVVVGPSTDP